MILLEENQKENIEYYEIENKKYKVISKSIPNCENIDKLYNILCKYIMYKLK